MLIQRMKAHATFPIRMSHLLRTFAMRQELAEQKRVRYQLYHDPSFRAFHEGRNDTLPKFYHDVFERRLGRYAELIPPNDRLPLPRDQASAEKI
jgi:hypothetical protein